MKPNNNVTVELFTQLGHDEYFDHHPNEKYWLHFDEFYMADGTLQDLENELGAVCAAIRDDDHNVKIAPYSYISKKVNRGAEYLLPRGRMLAGPDLENLQNSIIDVCQNVATATAGRVTKIKHDPTDELSLQITIQY